MDDICRNVLLVLLPAFSLERGRTRLLDMKELADLGGFAYTHANVLFYMSGWECHA